MAECESLPGCGFCRGQIPVDIGFGAMYKKKYCLGDNMKCARHMVFKKFGKGTVPSNLYPNSSNGRKRFLPEESRTPDLVAIFIFVHDRSSPSFRK
jgi:hypothetical protein